jgi:hypothetical protein
VCTLLKIGGRKRDREVHNERGTKRGGYRDRERGDRQRDTGSGGERAIDSEEDRDSDKQ